MPTPKLLDERQEAPAPDDATVVDPFKDTPADDNQSIEDAVDDSLPEKYRGKSVAELAAMLVESERFQGQQANEVGELRRSVDMLIQAQLESASAPAKAEPTVEEEQIDFFTDPDKAVDQKIANHPDVVEARREREKLRKLTSKQELQAKHPDMDSIVADAEFAKWVQQSPVRTELLRKAHFEFDFDSANELFTNWKERAELAQREQKIGKEEQRQALKSAATGDANASQSGAPKKVYRRADIVRLQNEDPERYLAMSDEILKAYREKRGIEP